MAAAIVSVVRTRPETVLEDYGRVMRSAGSREVLGTGQETLIKLNLSWTKFFPACSTAPWQLEGALRTLLEDGASAGRLYPVENRTVVTDPWKGAANNRWLPVLQRYGLPFIALHEAEWMVFRFKTPLLRLNQLFPEGIEIPRLYPGKQVLHLPTLKTHGHTVTTGAVKNSFGGLLKEVRHYAHKYIHEVMVDLMLMQRELHPVVFSVMDGTVCGDGAGPRTMIPRIKNYLLASADSVALDAVAAGMMGFHPLDIPYIRLCHEMGLGVGDPDKIRVVGENVAGVHFGFRVKRSLVVWGDQLIRRGALRPLERLLLHSPLVGWAPFASNIYHDLLWYPLIGRPRIREFMATPWGRLFASYPAERPRSGTASATTLPVRRIR
ncbi:MAG: DUF362 domain-containing protein [Alphaproteobacteria bacterium]